MNRELRIGALLATIEEYRRARCDEYIAAARTEARRVHREAHAAARAKVRAVLTEERERLESEVASRQARLQTERRLAQQRGVSALLGEAWPLLRSALEEAWGTRASRLRWASRHLALAAGLLPGRGWRVCHASGLSGEERARLAHALEAGDIEWVEAPALRAGLVIEAGRNFLDASLDGVLAERQALESRLLVLLEDAAR